VIDNRPKGSAADLVKPVPRRFDAGFEDHIAVMLESWWEQRRGSNRRRSL
jgi:hypothetical protein